MLPHSPTAPGAGSRHDGSKQGPSAQQAEQRGPGLRAAEPHEKRHPEGGQALQRSWSPPPTYPGTGSHRPTLGHLPLTSHLPWPSFTERRSISTLPPLPLPPLSLQPVSPPHPPTTPPPPSQSPQSPRDFFHPLLPCRPALLTTLLFWNSPARPGLDELLVLPRIRASEVKSHSSSY